jgi:hypothetical protein
MYESDITSTNRQTGLALKSIFAQLINSTIVPVVTNIYVKKNTYEAEGLIYDIFFLSITNTLLPPILKIIDIPYRIKQFTIHFMLDDPSTSPTIQMRSSPSVRRTSTRYTSSPITSWEWPISTSSTSSTSPASTSSCTPSW